MVYDLKQLLLRKPMNDIKTLILSALNESIQDGVLVENIEHLATDIEQRVTEGVRQNVIAAQQSETVGQVTKFDTYQALAARTISLTDNEKSERDQLLMFTIGLAGEVGEIADPIKKHCFHANPKPLDREYFKLEIGDVLWYLSGLARHMKLSLSDCATANVRKLEQRHADKIKGVKPQVVVSEPTTPAVIPPPAAPVVATRVPGQRPKGSRGRGNGGNRSSYADSVRKRVNAGGDGGTPGADGFMDDEG